MFFTFLKNKREMLADLYTYTEKICRSLLLEKESTCTTNHKYKWVYVQISRVDILLHPRMCISGKTIRYFKSLIKKKRYFKSWEMCLEK